MDGNYSEGWYRHPQLGLIKVFENEEKGQWVYQCFSDSGARALSLEKPIDGWTWALAEKTKMEGE